MHGRHIKGRKGGKKGEGKSKREGGEKGERIGYRQGGEIERRRGRYKNPLLLISVVIMNSVVIIEIINNLSR